MDAQANQRLNTPRQRLLLLDYLCTELQAARMIVVNSLKSNEAAKVAPGSKKLVSALVF